MTGAAADSLGGMVAGLVVPALAVWRLTHLLWAEDGPWRVLVRARQFASARGARFIDCFYCLSLWVAAPFAVLAAPSCVAGVIDWLALSGAAILLERATTAAVEPPASPPLAEWREVLPNETVD